MVGWTFAAIGRASLALLDQAIRRATTRKASTPMGAHLDLPSNTKLANKAYKQQQVYQAYSTSLRFFEIGTEKYNMGRS
jgi:hypothetical protein